MGNGVGGRCGSSREIPGSRFWMYVELQQQQYCCTRYVFLGQAYAVTEVAASVSGSNSSSSSSTATAVVVEGVDGRSIGVQYGTWDFDRNHRKRSIIRIRGRIIVAGEGEAR